MATRRKGMAMIAHEKIIEQIRSIRRLMDNAGTEGEAAAAAAAMARLLSKYNLDLAEIPVDSESDERDEAISKEEILTQTKNNDYKWREELLTAVASNNFCRVLHTEKWVDGKVRAHMILIGQPHNREVAKFLYELLASTLERLSKAHSTVSPERKHELELAKALGIKPRYTFSPRRSFLYGAVTTISQRLRAEWIQFATPVDGNDKALVLVKNNARDLSIFVQQTWPKLGVHRIQEDRRATLDEGGFRAGQEAGRNIGLHRAVGGGGNTGSTRALGEGKR
jgi:hypothetical protein